MFGLGGAKLVQFRDGTFGIKRGLLTKEFLGVDEGFIDWYVSERGIYRYCKFQTKEEALETYEKISISYKVISVNLDDVWEVW